MRALLAVLIATTAFADDKLTLPDLVKEATTQALLHEPDVVKGIDGKPVAGIVIKPAPHPDDKMVVTPPDPNDPMALEMGTNQLRNRIARTAWLPRDLSLGAKRAADAVWDLVLPKL